MNCPNCDHKLEVLKGTWIDPDNIHWLPIDTTIAQSISIEVRKNGEILGLSSEQK